MSPPQAPDLPFVRSVFHPSDFSKASENAFAHALAIALVRQTQLTILHVAPEHLAADQWREFPAVRATLERWGLLEKGSPRSAVFEELAVQVKKVALRKRKPRASILEYLDEHPTDLIVLATQGRDGVSGWLQRSVAEPVARRSETITLFVPEGARGFVDPEHGELSLRRILVPVDHRPDPRAAVVLATRAAQGLGNGEVSISLLHVGAANEPPALELPEGSAWSWKTELRRGDAVEQILAVADETSADLIAMVTEGREGALDALRGTTTERVLRNAPCPVLAVPASLAD